MKKSKKSRMVFGRGAGGQKTRKTRAHKTPQKPEKTGKEPEKTGKNRKKTVLKRNEKGQFIKM